MPPSSSASKKRATLMTMIRVAIARVLSMLIGRRVRYGIGVKGIRTVGIVVWRLRKIRVGRWGRARGRGLGRGRKI